MTTPPPSRRLVASSAPATLLLLLLTGAADAAPPLVGVFSQDEAYFAPQVIACRDGSGSFPRSRLNDGYCDCADGTDEPGTSACPEGKFYCRNTGDTPRFLFSSFVNDKICGRDGKNSRLFIRCTCQIIKQPLSYGCTRFGFAFNAAPVLHLPPNFCNVLACLGRHGPQILIFHSNYKLQIREYGNVVADHGPFSIRLSSSLQGL